MSAEILAGLLYAIGGISTYMMLKALEELLMAPAPRGMIPLLVIFWPITVPSLVIGGLIRG